MPYYLVTSSRQKTRNMNNSETIFQWQLRYNFENDSDPAVVNWC